MLTADDRREECRILLPRPPKRIDEPCRSHERRVPASPAAHASVDQRLVTIARHQPSAQVGEIFSGVEETIGRKLKVAGRQHRHREIIPPLATEQGVTLLPGGKVVAPDAVPQPGDRSVEVKPGPGKRDEHLAGQPPKIDGEGSGEVLFGGHVLLAVLAFDPA